MTQTNTTQNKEELELLRIGYKFFSREELEFLNMSILQDKVDRAIENLLSQAHQSGIEEGRKAILEEVRSLPRYPTTEMATYENGYNEGHNNAIIDIIQMLERQKLSLLEGNNAHTTKE